MSDFHPFIMERFMSRFEQEVEYNLSESGVHPLTLSELMEYDTNYIMKIIEAELNYPHANGIPFLRENIARLYEGAKPDNVLVTVGAIEANYNTVRTLLSDGDEIVVMLPNYMQIWGIAINHNYQIKTFHLQEEKNWAPDLDELEDIVSEKTRLIAICNPNNPTGYVLSQSETDQIVHIADKNGAWILADEVYSGTEHNTEEETPSFYGRYEKVIAVGSMSKAYGLPGLRLGWLAGPVEMVDEVWARHEYTTISASMLSNLLAAFALSKRIRPALIKRSREYVRKGFPVLQQWMDRHPGTFSCIPPQAAAIAFVKYNLDINSTVLAEKLIHEKSVLIIPGDHFGMDKFLRISFGLPEGYLIAALNKIHELIRRL